MLLTTVLVAAKCVIPSALQSGKLEWPPVDNGSGIPAIPDEISGSLPKDFMWGLATAAYQIEGAIGKDGQSDSVWDAYAAQKGRIDNGDIANVSANQYHLYKEDIRLMKEYGLKVYRMSIAWTRLVPGGIKGSPVNQKAVDHYNDVFNSLIEAGITPLVTLFHWDLPQILEETYDGYLNHQRYVEDFVYYADAAFSNFGDRIKHWITINEPWTFCTLGYSYSGPMAPGRCDDRKVCKKGNQKTEPWLCGHSQLLAHARTAELYHTKYAPKQQGKISLALNTDWARPLDPSNPKDVAAAQRRMDIMFGWYADPIYKSGDYPESMRAQLGDRLPKFTAEESALLRKSSDFFGLNHYTSYFVTDSDDKAENNVDLRTKTQFTGLDGKLIGPASAAEWLYDVPEGFYSLLKYVKERYNNPAILVTENGITCLNETNVPIEKAQHDTCRVNFYKGYTQSLVNAVKEGVNVIGYTGWSLADNFEWARGFTQRFGVTYVDYKTQKRYAKDSAWFLSRFFQKAIKK